jgi:hypothetical protein
VTRIDLGFGIVVVGVIVVAIAIWSMASQPPVQHVTRSCPVPPMTCERQLPN